jgi:hypothetical protein
LAVMVLGATAEWPEGGPNEQSVLESAGEDVSRDS